MSCACALMKGVLKSPTASSGVTVRGCWPRVGHAHDGDDDHGGVVPIWYDELMCDDRPAATLKSAPGQDEFAM